MRILLGAAGAVQFLGGLVLLILVFASLPEYRHDLVADEPIISLLSTVACTAILSGAVFIVGACLIRPATPR